MKSWTRTGARRLVCAALAVTVGFTSGCGTLFLQYGDQMLAVESTPSGAEVFVDGEPTELVTPCTLAFDLSDAETKTVTLQLPGYQTASYLVNRQARKWVMILDYLWYVAAIVPGYIFWTVDAMTGAAYQLKEDSCHIQLSRLPDPAPVADAQERERAAERELDEAQDDVSQAETEAAQARAAMEEAERKLREKKAKLGAARRKAGEGEGGADPRH